jgi:hypothetical protein
MRASPRRLITFVALAVAFVGSHPASAWAQRDGPRPVPLVEPVIATRLESLLSTPNLVLVVDYYRIDMRFGPNLRVDAVIVEAVESRERLKGLRVQVRDNDNRNRQEGTSFIDIEELATLTRGVTSMAELAAKWAQDDRQATELSFTTNGGFRLAVRQSARIPRAYLSTGLIDPVITSIDIAELPTLKQAFEQALAILSSKQ